MRSRVYHKSKNPVVFLLASLIIIVSAFFLSGAFLVLAKGTGSSEENSYYKSIQIQSGDTLWNIAEDYMTDEYNSVSEYIDELKQINVLDSDFIQSGQHLIVVCSN